ncbi:acyl-CoA dehydrogenase family protein [Phytohabitans aurantiacus]|uniref:Acyl-CoA dehydrogenase n=1 Tax=Phytohabitans aurantiacus TaxID=3016789 RepID=A0ABQ5QYA8_9ACTN|nr:acyl-CoA dehydrogenase family protein [Phytohabitans aurantiacus]GLH99533.1 putative acyl-CoA dehydrogenase [Phytohabitans aurantiacus]
MDFTPTDAQRDLAKLTREILADGIPDPWRDLAQAGVLAAALPLGAGGDGYGVLERASILVELGRAAAPLPYLPSIATAAAAIARFGTGEQVERWAGPAGQGSPILTAALEAADPFRVSRENGRWVVSGAATAVPAPSADLFLVPAGARVFLVEPGDAGVTVETQEVLGGPGAGWLTLDGAVLPDDRVLGEPDAGESDGRVESWLRAHATVGACAAQLGVTERALEMTAEYAGTRVQFGRPIGSFQAVAQRLADAYIDVEAIRLTMWQAAWRLSEDLPCAAEIATAKFWAADGGHRVAHAAVHVHGGVGIDLDSPLHRYFLAAKYHEFTLGTATDHLRTLGTTLTSP